MPKRWRTASKSLIIMIAPTAPHLAEELWHRLGHKESVHNQSWPKWDEALAKEEEITLVVQVNGKLRDRPTVPASITEEEAKKWLRQAKKYSLSFRVKPLLMLFMFPGNW